MNPMTLLRLWRERWGLSEGRPLGEPYLVGAGRTTWGSRWVVQASSWSARSAILLALLLALPLFATAALVPTDLDGQWMFACVLLAMALYVRRYMGTLPFLVLIGLTLLAGARYLAWRYGATLPPVSWSAAGWLLWLAECLAWLSLTLWMCGYLWPVARPSTELTEVIDEWPYVDVLVVAGNAEPSTLRALLRAVRALDWPADRLRVFVRDQEGTREWRRDGLQPATGAPTAATSATDLPDGNGAMVLRVDATGPDGQLDDPLLLQNWLVWMQRDPFLALLHGHASDLAPPPSPQVRALLCDAPGAAVSLLRRSAVAQSSRASSDESLAERLDRSGHRTALMGLAREEERGGSESRWLRVDLSNDIDSVRARMRWRALARALRKPAHLALYAMAAAGLSLPLFGVLPIEAPLPSFMAYALPYAALAGLTWRRTGKPRRAAMAPEMRDWALALILPPLTAAYALAAALRGRRSVPDDRSGTQRGVPSRRMAASIRAFVDASWFVIGVAALLAGVSRLYGASPTMRAWLAAACIVIGYALLLRIAQWAVDREMRALRAQQAAMRVQPAQLQIEGDTLIELEVLEFPAQPLRLRIADIETMRLGPLASELIAGGRDLPGLLRLRNAPDAPLQGNCTVGPARELLIVPDSASAERLEMIAERLRVDYLKRRYWLPGSRLSNALREVFGADPSNSAASDRTASLRAPAGNSPSDSEGLRAEDSAVANPSSTDDRSDPSWRRRAWNRARAIHPMETSKS